MARGPPALGLSAMKEVKSRAVVTRLQDEALAGNAGAIAAQQAFAKALAAVAALRQQFDASLKDDPAVQNVKATVASARISATSAEQGLATAQKDLAKQQTARAAAIAEQRRGASAQAAQAR